MTGAKKEERLLHLSPFGTNFELVPAGDIVTGCVQITTDIVQNILGIVICTVGTAGIDHCSGGKNYVIVGWIGNFILQCCVDDDDIPFSPGVTPEVGEVVRVIVCEIWIEFRIGVQKFNSTFVDIQIGYSKRLRNC